MPHPNCKIKEEKYKKVEKFLWIDMEMTGLDIEQSYVLEIACLVTDKSFKVLDEIGLVIHQQESVLEKMDTWCQKTFLENGLLEKIRKSNLNIVEADNLLFDFLDKNFDRELPIILAGNSIHQDRKFIKKFLPKLENSLHYRMLDVSSFKIIFENIYHKEFPKDKQSHLAIDDIKYSIRELKFYLNNI